MDVSKLPFNQLINLQLADKGSDFLVCFPDKSQYTNHLGTVHASALLSLAEAGSGQFLFESLGEFSGFTPVVRKVEAKFRKPATGKVSARCLVLADEVTQWKQDLLNRGRLSVSLPMEVVDREDVAVLTATIEWFIVKNT